MVFPYAPNAVLVGFLSSFAAGVIGMFILYALDWTVIIPGWYLISLWVQLRAYLVTLQGTPRCYFRCFAQGLLITFLPVFLLPVLGDIGIANTI